MLDPANQNLENPDAADSSPEETQQAQVAYHILKGDNFWYRGEIEEAVASYYQALEIDANTAVAHQKLGKILKQQGKIAESLTHYRQAVSLGMDSADNPERIDNTNREKSLETSEKAILSSFSSQNSEESPRPSHKEINTVQQQQPPYLDLRNSNSSTVSRVAPQGSLAKQENNNGQLSLNFSAARVYLEQALGYCEEKQWSSAIQACQNALNIDPKFTEAYKTWGNILQKMGNSTEALGYYAKALELEPNLAEVYANVGSIYAQKEKWENAIAYYQKAIALNPKFAGAYRNIAKVWTKIGQIQRAEEANRQALALEPEKASPQELCQIGDSFAAQNSFKEAKFYYRQAIAIKPSWIDPYYKLAAIAEKMNEWQEAAMYYRKISELRTIELGLVKKALVSKTLPSPNLVEFPRLRANGQ
jgi:tetratricopeptide (TPR) repeat protein